MKRQLIGLAPLMLMTAPGLIFAQGTGGTGSYSGNVPEAYSISNASNGNLAGTLGSFSTLTIGKGTLATPSTLQVRLRSNHTYKLTANAAVTSGITDGPASAPGTAALAIKTGDIGFGFRVAIDQSGASVVNGGASPSRADNIVTGFDATSGWPSVTDGHTPAFTKTLHDIYGGDIQILSGDRISASGDDGSSDNFIVVTLGIATLPQYLTPGAFSGTVTFTIATT
jgi:hypothetical protein